MSTEKHEPEDRREDPKFLRGDLERLLAHWRMSIHSPDISDSGRIYIAHCADGLGAVLAKYYGNEVPHIQRGER